MISALTNWIRYIVYIILFAAFLELLLPSNRMQRFIRLILGLLIMLAILNPVLSIMHKGMDAEALPVFAGSEEKKQAIMEHAKTMARERERLAMEMYKRELIQQMHAMVTSVPGVKDAKIVLEMDDGGKVEVKNLGQMVRQVTIYVKAEGATGENGVSPSVRKKVMEFIGEMYQLPKEKIRIQNLHS
jgi:stage III sporulation protein AF